MCLERDEEYLRGRKVSEAEVVDDFDSSDSEESVGIDEADFYADTNHEVPVVADLELVGLNIADIYLGLSLDEPVVEDEVHVSDSEDSVQLIEMENGENVESDSSVSTLEIDDSSLLTISVPESNEMEEEEFIYEVEAILAKKVGKKCVVTGEYYPGNWYLIKWAGYGHADDT